MSDFFLLETDVASYLLKNSPSVKSFRRHIKGKRPVLAFVSVAELFKWTLKRGWSSHEIRVLEDALPRYVVIPHDRDLRECRPASRLFCYRSPSTTAAPLIRLRRAMPSTQSANCFRSTQPPGWDRICQNPTGNGTIHLTRGDLPGRARESQTPIARTRSAQASNDAAPKQGSLGSVSRALADSRLLRP
jgi:hypothetical protein